MASTTSAAASMLLSGSSSSRTGSSQSASSSAIAADLQGLNFYLSDNSKTKQFYMHNPSLSSTPSCPTITLDLTSNPSVVSSQFNRFSSSYPTIPRFASTNLNFSSSESGSAHWGNGILSYGSTSQPYNRNLFGNVGLGKSPFDTNVYQPYMPKNAPSPLHQAPSDTIAAATKAITADPNFQSALAAALSSIIGTGNSTASANPSGGDNNNIAQKSKLGEHIPMATSSFSSPPQSNACATSYLTRTTPANSPPGSLMFMPPSLPFTSPRNAAASPGEKTTAISDLEMRL